MRLQLEYGRISTTVEAEAGRALVLLDADGDSATALLEGLAGFAPGRLRVDGTPAAQPPQRRFAYCAAEAQLLPRLTVEANLQLAMGQVSDKAREAILRLLQLEELLPLYPAALSPAQAHAVALARAVLNQPQLLLIDQPRLPAEALQHYYRCLTLLLPRLPFPVITACRRVDDAARLGEQWLYLADGELQATGDADRLLLDPNLPLGDSETAAFRIEAIVASHDRRYGLSHLDFRGGRLVVPLCNRRVGKGATAMVPLAGAQLSLSRPTPSSHLNTITVRIEALHPRADGQVLLQLASDGPTLLLRLPQRAVDQLKLQPGMEAFALYPRAEVAA